MKINPSIRNIILLWLGWTIVLLAFQHWVQMRVELRSPDHFLDPAQLRSPYLNDPFMNSHLSWDSEFYLSIATVGYDDPAVRGIHSNFEWNTDQQSYCVPSIDPDCYSLNYAYFPLYPFATRLFSYPLRLINLTPIARSTLAAVTLSLLGTLGAMLALYFMTKPTLGEEGGLRPAFYLLIFPSSFFLSQVYTEGLFIGLTFGTLAFLVNRKWTIAALLAVLAAWTRPGGAILLLPMIIVWLIDKPWKEGWKPALSRGLAALSPALSYVLWSLTPLAYKFHIVEDHYFDRGLLAIGPSILAWGKAFTLLVSGTPPFRFYYGLELIGVTMAVMTSIWLWREHPEISAYGLAMVVFAFTSGIAQSMIRYMLVVPALFWITARWGKNPVFDRIWTLVCILLLGMEVMLFSFDFWVG
jgi:hypothetical protein